MRSVDLTSASWPALLELTTGKFANWNSGWIENSVLRLIGVCDAGIQLVQFRVQPLGVQVLSALS